MKSIRSHLLFYLSLAAMISTLTILFSIWLHRHLSLRAEMKIEGTKLANTATQQAEMIIPGLLLEEEYGAVAPQLAEIKKQENLIAIDYYPNGSPIAERFAECEESTGGARLCYNFVKNTAATLTAISVGHNRIGYLHKAKPVQIDYSAGWYSFLILLFANLIIFLGLIISVLWFMQSRIRQPLQSMLRQYKTTVNDKTFDTGVFQLKELNEIANELNQAIIERQNTAQAVAQSEIARQVAHDIRGPISLIEALIQKLKRHEDSAEEAELLGSVAKRIHNIADDLLERHLTPETQNEIPLDIVANFISFLKELEKRAHLASIQFTADLCHIQNLKDIKINPLHLNRTISNLYDNALQACHDLNNAQIYLSIRQNPITQTLTICIEDTGRGIPDVLIPKLGTKGFTWGKSNGSGLGLYQARQFCQRHGGELSVANRSHGGSVIKLIFPIHAELQHQVEEDFKINTR